MQKTFRIAIAGCGKIAHEHAKAIRQLSSAKMVAVWSRTFASAEKFAGQYDVTPYKDVKTMVVDAKVDLMIVCTPHPWHKEPALLAAEGGAHVLVEKPLASNLQDCDTMIKACRDADVKLGVVSQRRWYPAAERVKKAIQDNKIGKPVLGTAVILGWRDQAYYESDAWRGTWQQEGGGVLVNQAPHQLDLLNWYMGEIEEVYGIWKNLNHPYIEVEDTAVAIIKYKNGGIGNIVVSNSQKPGIYGKVHVHGENGASVGVQTDGGAMFIAGMTNILEPPVNDLWTIPGEESRLEEWKSSDTDFFNRIDPISWFLKCQIEDFLHAIVTGTEPMSDGAAGRRTVELFTAIYRSSRDNAPVRFPLMPENQRNDMDGRLLID